MKLIDLLVQELPKRGGWPKGAEYARVTGFGGEKLLVDFLFPEAYNKLSYSIGIIACHLIDAGTDVDCHMIRRDSYESALAASQMPAWNGEGVPQVGCECECSWAGDEWQPCKILFTSNQFVVVKLKGSDMEDAYNIGDVTFRPLLTEADKRRDAATKAMQRAADDGNNWIYSEYEIIYDAIAAGKIPGVKLED